jgi:uncharacterized protein (TIGR03032 family)
MNKTLELSSSRLFTSWLDQERISLAFTTYQAGKLFLIGRRPDGQLSGFERTFPRCMGMWSDGQTLWLTSLYQIWRLENVLPPGDTDQGFDRCYVPQVGYTTGDVDVHDVAVDADGQPVFANTLFSCLATVDERFSFRPLWMPGFVSKLAAEDRCHLNGLAMSEGRPRYVTACAESDVFDGWRNHRIGGGIVVDVDTNTIVCQGLTMPHSPRTHDGRLWLLDSGSGFFGHTDVSMGRFEPVTFCPGYARGLAFIDRYAVIGLSKCRHERTFSGLPLEKNLADLNAQATCGLVVVDTRSGDVVHWLKVEGVVEELYDVAVLPNVVRPKALGFKTDEIRHTVWLEDDGHVQRWTAHPKHESR